MAQVTSTEIRTAYEDLKNATREEAEARAQVEEKRKTTYADNRDELAGARSNEARSLMLDALLQEDGEYVDMVEARREAETELEVANIEVKKVNALVGLLRAENG